MLGEDVERRRTVEVQVPGVHSFSTRCWSRARDGVVRPTRPSNKGLVWGLSGVWVKPNLGFLSSSPFPWLSPFFALARPPFPLRPAKPVRILFATRAYTLLSFSLHSLADPFIRTQQVWLTLSRRPLCPRPHPSPPPGPPSPLKTHTPERPFTNKQSLPQTSFASHPSALGTKESCRGSPHCQPSHPPARQRARKKGQHTPTHTLPFLSLPLPHFLPSSRGEPYTELFC